MKHLRDAVAQVLPEAVAMWQELHRHPELSGQEYDTRDYICRKLTQWNIPYRLCSRNLGVIADIGQGEPCVALRADMDALPVLEQTGAIFASENPGVMHACGHDLHVAVLLAMGRLLTRLPPKGTVRLLFQPAEETTGGAADMIAEGCMENPKVSAVLGFHVDPGCPAGTAAFLPGTMNAAATDFILTVHGQGCHGAHPENGVDAIVAAAQVVSALQSVISRTISPTESGVVTIGTIQGGTKENIIADKVTMTGTIRALQPKMQKHLKDTVLRVATNTAAAYDAFAQLDMEDLCPALINDTELTRRMQTCAAEILGAEKVITFDGPSLGADDFAFFSEQVPGCYFNVGARNDTLPNQTLHSPTFLPHEGCIETALLLLCAAVAELSE